MKSLYESILSTTNSGRKAVFKSFDIKDIYATNPNVKLNKILNIKKIKDYIAKVRDHEVFYELDENGDETDEIVKDAYGEDFHPDALILDGTSVLKLVSSQSLLDLSRKRNKIKKYIRLFR